MKPRVVLAVTARPALDVIVGHVDHLNAAGWDVHLVVGEPAPSRLFPGARVHVLPMRRDLALTADAVAMRKWIELLRDLRPDVVAAATPKASFLGLQAARVAAVPHRVWWAWGLQSTNGGQRRVRWAERRTAAAATSIVAASPSLASTLSQITTAPPTVLGRGSIAGVDLDAFVPAAFEPAVPSAVFMGRLAADKGLADLVRIWDIVHAEVPDARLALAGVHDPEDPAPQALSWLESRPEVTMLGWVDDVAALLRQSQLLLLPSPRDGLPAAILEAAACSVPTVAWDVPGARDAIAGGRTGVLCTPGDHPAFARNVVTLLTNPEQRNAMGVRARWHVGRAFDRDTVEQSWERYLRSLVQMPDTVDITADETVDITAETVSGLGSAGQDQGETPAAARR